MFQKQFFFLFCSSSDDSPTLLHGPRSIQDNVAINDTFLQRSTSENSVWIYGEMWLEFP